MAGTDQIRKYVTTYTKDYKGPTTHSGMYNTLLNPERPVFFRSWIPLMMRDPHLWYGMELLKGPIITKAKYVVECDDMDVAEYVQRQIDKFWMRGVAKALDSLVWGYCGSEVIYEFNKQTKEVDFKDLAYIHPKDIKPVVYRGQIISMEVSNAVDPQVNPEAQNSFGKLYLKPPKFFWCVHDKKYNTWFGRSRLEGAFDTWWEIWQPKGYRGIRHLWYYRHAYDGGILYYPDGSTQDPETQEDIPNSLIAQEMLDRKETGSSLALPHKPGAEDRDWEYESPKGNQAPDGLLEYGDVLRDELWEGIGVPPEVAKSEGTGSFSGRRIPQQAFYSYIQEIANDICWDFIEQICKKLVKLRNGVDVPFTVNPVSIMETLQQEEMGLVTGSMGGQEGDNSQEQEFDEEGNPIEQETDEEGNPMQQDDGRVEDRDKNAFNMKQKSMKNQNGKGKVPPRK